MNKTEAFEIKAKYGTEAWYLALEIMQKDRTISFWTDKKNSAQFYIEQNQEKIKKIEAKLEKAKVVKN